MKKAFTLALALMMTASLLAGCADYGNSEATTEAAVTTISEETTTTAATTTASTTTVTTVTEEITTAETTTTATTTEAAKTTTAATTTKAATTTAPATTTKAATTTAAAVGNANVTPEEFIKILQSGNYTIEYTVEHGGVRTRIYETVSGGDSFQTKYYSANEESSTFSSNGKKYLLHPADKSYLEYSSDYLSLVSNELKMLGTLVPVTSGTKSFDGKTFDFKEYLVDDYTVYNFYYNGSSLYAVNENFLSTVSRTVWIHSISAKADTAKLKIPAGYTKIPD